MVSMMDEAVKNVTDVFQTIWNVGQHNHDFFHR